MRYNFLASGYPIIDEVINKSSSTASKIGHDLFVTTGFEIWTGVGKTGTKLTLTTDYSFSTENATYTAKVGSTVYTKVSIVNGAYLNTTLYLTYTTVGDLASVESIKEIAWPVYKTAAQWTTDNTVLEKGQNGRESDTGKEKSGDGVTAWNSLEYSNTKYSSGTHTITDASGAGLTISNGYQAMWEKKGTMVDVFFYISYPSTTDSSRAKLSLPLICNSTTHGIVDVGFSTLTTLRSGLINPNTSAFSFVSFDGSYFTNAQLSGVQIIGHAQYFSQN